MQAPSFFIGPHRTPGSVKLLIWITAVISLATPIISFTLAHFFQIIGPQVWLPLSRFGLLKGWLWQPLTYVFVHTAGVRIDLFFLLSLFFHLFLLWFTGAELVFRFGKKGFFLFYFGAALFAGLIVSGFLFLFSSNAFVFGSGPAVYALLVVWMMAYPDLEFFFFFLARVKARWLVVLFLGLVFLIQFTSGNWYLLLANLSGVLWGYGFGRMIWKLPNPFPFHSLSKKEKGGKIIDISSFQEDDDAFMDRMLDKLSKKGEGSLTKKERERMERISKKKHGRHS